MTQKSDTYSRLKRGPLTSQQAARELGILRLAARVNDLRLDGVKVVTTSVRVPTRRGTARIARYSL